MRLGGAGSGSACGPRRGGRGRRGRGGSDGWIGRQSRTCSGSDPSGARLAHHTRYSSAAIGTLSATIIQTNIHAPPLTAGMLPVPAAYATPRLIPYLARTEGGGAYAHAAGRAGRCPGDGYRAGRTRHRGRGIPAVLARRLVRRRP